MTTPSVHALPVIVGIDGSVGALDAARWAARYAARTEAPLRLVHAVPNSDWYGSAQYVDGGALEDELRRLGHGYLDRARAAALTLAPDLMVESISADGTIVDFFAETRAALVVLGSGHTGAVRDLLLGGDAIRIVNHAVSPVLLWRSDSIGEKRPIVVGVDGSDSSDRALVAALELASVLGVSVVASNFWGVAADLGTGLGAGYVNWQKVQDEEMEWLDRHVVSFCDKFPGVEVSTSSAGSPAAHGLLAQGASASVIVVGSRGHGRLRGTLLGSVSQNLIHHADCSVLVVR